MEQNVPQDPGASQPPETNGNEVEQLQVQLEEVNRKANTYLDLAQRAQADFLNYKRRTEQEREEQAQRAAGAVVLAILPILDDFERAVPAIPEERKQEEWVQGVLLIERKLRAALSQLGVERIDAEGQPFDPHQHEAVLHEEQAGREEGTVTRVFRPGYRLGSRVIRPAQVGVARSGG